MSGKIATGILLSFVLLLLAANCGKRDTNVAKRLTIGFNNSTAEQEFRLTVEQGLRTAARARNADLLVAYTEGDGLRMFNNVSTFMLQGADLVIDFNVIPEVGATLVKTLKEKNIPLISIDCKYEGAYFYGLNNERVGRIAGAAAADEIKRRWNGQLDLMVQLYVENCGPIVKLRNSGASDVIRETFPAFPESAVVWVDAPSTAKVMSQTVDLLTAHPQAKHIYIQVLSDVLAIGALRAAEVTNRKNDIIIISCDASNTNFDSCWIGSVAAFPEKYGEDIMAYAQDILANRAADKERYVNSVFICRENLNEYYPKHAATP